MGTVTATLDDKLTDFLVAQHLFFVATAPSGTGGHVNLSPKGHDTFRIVDPATVAYLDLTGSGVETIAHLRDNGRITLMFCAFSGPPQIVRLYGRGEMVMPGADDFDEHLSRFPPLTGVRSIIVVRLERIATSCGYSIPRMTYEGERDTLAKWFERKSPEELAKYKQKKNAKSIDGLPGLPGRSENG